MSIVTTSTSPVGIHLDVLLQAGALADCPAPQRAALERELRAAQRVFETTAAAAEETVKSRRYTEDGLRFEVARLVADAERELRPLDARAAELRTALEGTRAKALRSPVERNHDREVEIRRRLETRDPLEIRSLYITAIDRGDTEFVAAAENAPAMFPLLTADDRALGEAMKIAKSPFAAEVAGQEAMVGVVDTVAAVTRTELRKLAEQYGVELESQ